MHKNFSIIKALGWISCYWNRAEISSISYQDLKCGLLKNAFIKSDLLFNLQYSSLVSLQHRELQGLLVPAHSYSVFFNRYRETMFIWNRQHASIDYAWGWELAIPQFKFCWWCCLSKVARLFWIFLFASTGFHMLMSAIVLRLALGDASHAQPLLKLKTCRICLTIISR